MININGVKITGNNVSIINGRIVGGASNYTKIDETKTAKSNVKRIVVDGKVATVSITAGDSSNVSAHLYGDCNFDNSEPSLSVTDTSEEVRIDVKFSESFFSGSLCLHIVIPSILYHLINLSTESGDISVSSSVRAKQIQAKTKSGDVIINNNTSETLIASTMSGDIDIELIANSDVLINLKAMSGDIDVSLSNVETLNLQPSTMSGNIQNGFQSFGKGYIASLTASTMSGNIEIL